MVIKTFRAINQEDFIGQIKQKQEQSIQQQAQKQKTQDQISPQNQNINSQENIQESKILFQKQVKQQNKSIENLERMKNKKVLKTIQHLRSNTTDIQQEINSQQNKIQKELQQNNINIKQNGQISQHDQNLQELMRNFNLQPNLKQPRENSLKLKKLKSNMSLLNSPQKVKALQAQKDTLQDPIKVNGIADKIHVQTERSFTDKNTDQKIKSPSFYIQEHKQQFKVNNQNQHQNSTDIKNQYFYKSVQNLDQDEYSLKESINQNQKKQIILKLNKKQLSPQKHGSIQNIKQQQYQQNNKTDTINQMEQNLQQFGDQKMQQQEMKIGIVGHMDSSRKKELKIGIIDKNEIEEQKKIYNEQYKKYTTSIFQLDKEKPQIQSKQFSPLRQLSGGQVKQMKQKQQMMTSDQNLLPITSKINNNNNFLKKKTQTQIQNQKQNNSEQKQYYGDRQIKVQSVDLNINKTNNQNLSQSQQHSFQKFINDRRNSQQKLDQNTINQNIEKNNENQKNYATIINNNNIHNKTSTKFNTAEKSSKIQESQEISRIEEMNSIELQTDFRDSQLNFDFSKLKSQNNLQQDLEQQTQSQQLQQDEEKQKGYLQFGSNNKLNNQEHLLQNLNFIKKQQEQIQNKKQQNVGKSQQNNNQNNDIFNLNILQGQNIALNMKESNGRKKNNMNNSSLQNKKKNNLSIHNLNNNNLDGDIKIKGQVSPSRETLQNVSGIFILQNKNTKGDNDINVIQNGGKNIVKSQNTTSVNYFKMQKQGDSKQQNQKNNSKGQISKLLQIEKQIQNYKNNISNTQHNQVQKQETSKTNLNINYNNNNQQQQNQHENTVLHEKKPTSQERKKKKSWTEKEYESYQKIVKKKLSSVIFLDDKKLNKHNNYNHKRHKSYNSINQSNNLVNNNNNNNNYNNSNIKEYQNQYLQDKSDIYKLKMNYIQLPEIGQHNANNISIKDKNSKFIKNIDRQYDFQQKSPISCRIDNYQKIKGFKSAIQEYQNSQSHRGIMGKTICSQQTLGYNQGEFEQKVSNITKKESQNSTFSNQMYNNNNKNNNNQESQVNNSKNMSKILISYKKKEDSINNISQIQNDVLDYYKNSQLDQINSQKQQQLQNQSLNNGKNKEKYQNYEKDSFNKMIQQQPQQNYNQYMNQNLQTDQQNLSIFFKNTAINKQIQEQEKEQNNEKLNTSNKLSYRGIYGKNQTKIQNCHSHDVSFTSQQFNNNKSHSFNEMAELENEQSDNEGHNSKKQIKTFQVKSDTILVDEQINFDKFKYQIK